jgi:hypothetical protein
MDYSREIGESNRFMIKISRREDFSTLLQRIYGKPMPRKGKKVEEKQEEPAEKQKKARKPVRKKSIDLEEWISERLDEISSRLGLDLLGLSREELLAIITKIVEIVLGESRPDIDTIVRRIKRNEDRIRPLIALGILELRETLNEEQLEYIASAIGPWILTHANKLYRETKRLGKDEYLALARLEWNKQWMMQRDKTLPPECPICGFNSLMPDYTCIVCGSTPSTKAVAEHYKLEEYFENLAKKGDIEGLKKILDSNYVLISSTGIKIPGRDLKEKYDLEIHLTSSMRERIKSLVEKHLINKSDIK